MGGGRDGWVFVLGEMMFCGCWLWLSVVVIYLNLKCGGGWRSFCGVCFADVVIIVR